MSRPNSQREIRSDGVPAVNREPPGDLLAPHVADLRAPWLYRQRYGVRNYPRPLERRRGVRVGAPALDPDVTLALLAERAMQVVR